MTYERNLRIGVDSYTNDELVLSVYGNSSFSGIISATSFNGNFNGSIDISNYSNTSGISTSTIGGIVDVSDAIISGVSTLGFFTDDQLVSQSATLAPNTTYYTLHKNITVGSGATLSIGAGSTIILDRFNNLDDVKVNSLVSVGVITASSFDGNVPYSSVAGIATYATNAGISTQTIRFQNSRTFEITGDIIASPISFDGTGNVSLAATIQPNSVALGSDTTGDYVSTITGTSNQITVTSGTGEGSTPLLSIPSQFTAPQDVTVTRDLQVNRNLNVNGNITIGGTSATLFTTEFKVYDPDIVLGFRTDGSGNDISTDNTANHGGIAIASTEGTPLISLYDVGVGETNPATYKKFMWFKSGTFSGLGTDAWISNYAIGIGSTQFPTGTRLAAGSVQFTENDVSVVRNINATGIVTAAQFFGDGSGLDGVTGVSIIAQEVTGDPVYPTFASNVGVTTLGIAQTGFVYVPSTGSVGIGSTQPIATLDVNGDVNVSGVSTFIGIGTFQSDLYVGGNVNVSGVLTAERLYSSVYGEFTGGGISGTNIVGTSLSISGISTLGTLQISSGIVTATSGIITYYGDGSGLTGIVASESTFASRSANAYTATAGQTTFASTYTVGYVDVYLNGSKLTADQYTATNGSTIVLLEGASLGDILEVIGLQTTASSPVTRNAETLTIGPIASGITTTGTITLPKTGVMISIHPVGNASGWLRLYTRSDLADADASRARTQDPNPGSGVILETITSGISTVYLSPQTIFASAEETPINTFNYRFTKDGTAGITTFTFKYLSLEP